MSQPTTADVPPPAPARLRRLRSHEVESQQGRCPWCGRWLVAVHSAQGPAWRCSCSEPRDVKR